MSWALNNLLFYVINYLIHYVYYFLYKFKAKTSYFSRIKSHRFMMKCRNLISIELPSFFQDVRPNEKTFCRERSPDTSLFNRKQFWFFFFIILILTIWLILLINIIFCSIIILLNRINDYCGFVNCLMMWSYSHCIIDSRAGLIQQHKFCHIN